MALGCESRIRPRQLRLAPSFVLAGATALGILALHSDAGQTVPGPTIPASVFSVTAIDLTAEELEVTVARQRIEEQLLQARRLGARFAVLPGPAAAPTSWPKGEIAESIPG